MPNPVVVDFLVRGMPEVARAFRTVQQAALAAERATRRSAEASAQQATQRTRISQQDAPRVRIGGTPTPQRRIDVTTSTRSEQTAARTSSAARPSRARPVNEEERKQKSADKEAKEKVKSQLKVDADVKKIQDNAIKDTEKRAKSKAAAERREEAKLVREAEARGRERVKISKDVDREFAAMSRKQEKRERDRNRENTRIQKDAAREEKRQTREREKAASTFRREDEKFARGVGGGIVRIGGAVAHGAAAGVGKVAGITAQVAGIAGQLGGGFSIGDAVTNEAKLRKQAAVLSASTILSGAGKEGADKALGKAVTTDEVLSASKRIGIEQNIDPAEVMAGIDAIKAKTGNVSAAMDMIPHVVKLASITGASVADTSKLAGQVMALNPNISQKEMEAQMNVLTKQGVVGGVELPDVAKYGARLTAGASLFGTDAQKGVTSETNTAVLGAMAQMSAQYGGASSAAEATMASQRFSTDVAKNADALKADLGIDVRDGKGTLKSAEDITIEMLKATKGDVTRLGDTGLGDRGVKTLYGAGALYRKAELEKKGSGEAAVRAEYKKYTTGITPEEVEAASKRVLAEQQAEIEMRKLTLMIGQELLPEFAKLIPTLRELTPVLVDFLKTAAPEFIKLLTSLGDFAKANQGIIDTIAQHPVGTLIGAEITKSFAAAALPGLLKSLFTASFASGGAGVPAGVVPGAGGGAPGAAGAGNPAGAIVAGIVAQGYGAYDLYSGTKKAIAGGTKEGASLADRMAAGDPEAAAQFEEAKKKSSTMDRVGAWSERVGRGFRVAASPVTAATDFLGDAATEALGYKTGAQKSKETLAAKATVDEVNKKALEANQIVDDVKLKELTAKAIGDGLTLAVQRSLQGGENPIGPPRPAGPPPPPAAAGTGIVQRTQ